MQISAAQGTHVHAHHKFVAQLNWVKRSAGRVRKVCPSRTTSTTRREFKPITLARVLMAGYTTEREEQSFDEVTPLIVSLKTAPTHTQNIYAKIGVNNQGRLGSGLPGAPARSGGKDVGHGERTVLQETQYRVQIGSQEPIKTRGHRACQVHDHGAPPEHASSTVSPQGREDTPASRAKPGPPIEREPRVPSKWAERYIGVSDHAGPAL